MAWEHLGWKAAWYSEIDSFPSAVLSHRFPDVPNLGDMTKIHTMKVFQDEPVDLIVGGTPCQSFSLAGLRKGMADPRGNLALTYLSLVDRKRPRWIVWENVPGVLSSNNGRDFGAFLGGLGQLGYGFAYRVLDAQYFGVAQRRRRVFVVGYLGDWRPAAAVLFEPHSLHGHNPPSRSPREGIASFTASGFGDYREGCGTLRAQGGDYGGGTETLIAETFAIQESATSENMNNGPQGKGYQKHIAYTLEARHHTQYVAHTLTARHDSSPDGSGRGLPILPDCKGVRRLTPCECERLQGFPDNWTQVPYRGKPAADGPRYKTMGNSMAVPVMRWIGERIEKYDQPH